MSDVTVTEIAPEPPVVEPPVVQQPIEEKEAELVIEPVTAPDEVVEEVVKTPDYEYAGIFEGDMRFLSCAHCGALIAADAVNISRHTDMHRKARKAASTSASSETSFAGGDLARLLRETVRHEMTRRGMTQVQVSKVAGVSQKHLSQVLTGHAFGSLELWSKVATALDSRWSITLVDTPE